MVSVHENKRRAIELSSVELLHFSKHEDFTYGHVLLRGLSGRCWNVCRSEDFCVVWNVCNWVWVKWVHGRERIINTIKKFFDRNNAIVCKQSFTHGQLSEQHHAVFQCVVGCWMSFRRIWIHCGEKIKEVRWLVCKCFFCWRKCEVVDGVKGLCGRNGSINDTAFVHRPQRFV